MAFLPAALLFSEAYVNCSDDTEMSTSMTDREEFIRLNLVPEIGSLRIARLLQAFGSVREIFAASEQAVQHVEGIGPILARRLIAAFTDPRPAEDELKAAQRAGCTVMTIDDADYPAVLRELSDPPIVLYLKGRWLEEDRMAVGIVGSRRASAYGLQMAQRLGAELGSRGLTVVSGLARGIDTAAHRGTLRAGGRTIAVLGNGLSSIYPPEHRELAEEITRHGAVLSEYPMGMPPLAENFPRRNRLISGLSLGVVIVEAAKRSGALITADCALEQGKDVFAVPGQADAVSSQGTNQLIKQGAKLVTSVEDILEELRVQPVLADVPEAVVVSQQGPSVSDGDPEAHTLVTFLRSRDVCDLDTLAVGTGLPAATCAAALLRLELAQQVKQLPGKRFARAL